MKVSLYLNDFDTEKIFSYLRWLFLAVSVLLFYFPPLDNILQYEHSTFPILLTIGFVYMAVSQTVLHKMDTSNPHFPSLLKAGIIFDYIALMWLLALSGGVKSHLFPIAYLFVMHAAIYWRTKGAISSAASFIIGFTVVFMFEPARTPELWFDFILKVSYVCIIGLLGSLLVLRERQHFRMREIYHELVVTDYLTGLYNHRHFQEHLKSLSDKNEPFLLVMGDIDHFKKINDTYGHLAGDEVLRFMGKIFTETATEYNGIAFRYGGEEFAFLLPDLPPGKMDEFFFSLYHRINEKGFTTDDWKVTMSFGVGRFTPGNNPGHLLGMADTLLYNAKTTGKNRVCFEGDRYFYNKQWTELQLVK